MTRKIRCFDEITLTGRELARCFRLTPARVSQLTRTGVLRRDIGGEYSLTKNLHRYREFLDRAAERRASPAANRLAEARARAIERRTAAAAEQLVDFRETAKVFAEAFAVLRDGLNSIPLKFAAHRLDGALSDEIFDAFARAERRARAGLAKLAKNGELQVSQPGEMT